MSRRPSLPGAAELFRATAAEPSDDQAESGRNSKTGAVLAAAPDPVGPGGQDASDESRPGRNGAGNPIAASVPAANEPATTSLSRRSASNRAVRSTRRVHADRADRAPSGRERHEEKITVYCSAEELLELEQARLLLRAEHGLAVDRGRIVREALAVVLADLESKGDSSILVRRLREA
ncbi:MAG: hypothetical protein JO147_11635 [Actinobacteria bacterium]|nr:hypothetical protein [Actinomycetota bacterium]